MSSTPTAPPAPRKKGGGDSKAKTAASKKGKGGGDSKAKNSASKRSSSSSSRRKVTVKAGKGRGRK
jgi:hypothetical protein